MMSEKETQSYATANLEGEHLTGAFIKTLLLVLLAVVVVAGGVGAWLRTLPLEKTVTRRGFFEQ
jgi:hypothetical protein